MRSIVASWTCNKYGVKTMYAASSQNTLFALPHTCTALYCWLPKLFWAWCIALLIIWFLRRDERCEFIRAKYVDKKFAVRSLNDERELLDELEHAVSNKNLYYLLEVFAEGVDLSAPLPSSVSTQLRATEWVYGKIIENNYSCLGLRRNRSSLSDKARNGYVVAFSWFPYSEYVNGFVGQTHQQRVSRNIEWMKYVEWNKD